uniref:Zinc metalloproteinase n=1 Tax=Haemonchus contortus TaxID=6289 RepID=A0A7I4YHI2_HAECO
MRQGMIGVLLLLTVLFDSSLCLSEKGRIALTKAYGGINIEERRERLRNLGLSASEQNTISGTAGQTTLVDSTSEDVLDGETTAVDDDSILAINRREGIDEYLYGGDMILTEEQLSALEHPTRQKRQIRSGARRWENNTVSYYFDVNITAANQDLVRTHLKYISNRTCVKFVENANATNRIKVIDGSGCWSYVGMLSREQELSLASGCFSQATVVHEFMHALGVQHMHMRSDRDKFLKVNLTYVNPNSQHNFAKDPNSLNLTPFEYGSVMQYSSNSFSTNGNSMTPLTAGFGRTMGSRLVSFYDIRMINIHYKCNVPCNGLPKTAKCLNGGAPNPKNCKVCLCPLGYGGGLCGQRKPGCGAALVAASTWKGRNITVVRNTTTPTSEPHVTCNDWITAPAGKKIQVRLMKLTNVQCRNGCTVNAFEPKLMANKAITNRRLCCDADLTTIRTSNISPMPVVAYTSSNVATTFFYHYRFI